MPIPRFRIRTLMIAVAAVAVAFAVWRGLLFVARLIAFSHGM